MFSLCFGKLVEIPENVSALQNSLFIINNGIRYPANIVSDLNWLMVEIFILPE